MKRFKRVIMECFAAVLAIGLLAVIVVAIFNRSIFDANGLEDQSNSKLEQDSFRCFIHFEELPYGK